MTQSSDAPSRETPPAEQAPAPTGTEDERADGGPGVEKDSDYSAGMWLARLEKVRRLLPRSAYFWISARLSARFGDEYQWKNRDDEENDRGIPPKDERIAWHGVWVVEAFLPSTVSSLVAGVERLGWWESHRDQSFAQNVAAGRSGRGGGWATLPLLRRRTTRRTYGLPNYDRELPEGVEYVAGHIHYVTPSLTVLIAGFRFDPSVSVTLDQALRRRYMSYHEMIGWTASRSMTPMFQRREAVRDLEKARIDGCRTWLAKHLPGYFASGDDSSTPPATLLVTTQVVVPFERTEESGFWAQEAGIDFALERWETGIDGLRYAFRPREEGVAVLAGRESDIFANPDDRRKYGHENTIWSLMYVIESNLAPLMAFRAVDAVLSDIRRRLGRLRDSVAFMARASSKEQLSSVQAQLGTVSSDLTAITSEVRSWPNREAWVLHDIPDIEAIDDFPNPNAGVPSDPKPLKRRLLDWCVEQAREVRDFEADTRALLVAAAEIAGALETIKLQSFVRWVSVLALLVSLTALIVGSLANAGGNVAATPIPSFLSPLP